MGILKASVRLQKLRAMSLVEIADRVRYRGLLAVERALHASGRLKSPRSLEETLRRDLRGGEWRTRLLAARGSSAATFYPGVRDRAAIRDLFAGPYAAERALALEHARRAREHRFAFFGREFQFGPEIDWQKDPVTGAEWPARFHADVPVHGGDVGYGDVKHVWELSRQQYLIDLAKVAFLEDSAADRAAMAALVRGWMAGNPYATGVNWSCALEPAFRAWSWLWAYHLTADSLEPDFHLEWLVGFYDHGRFLAKHLEFYSSPYNHLVGEACALYALGLLFPEFEASASWRRLGRSVLEERLGQQFYADGGSVEQSTFYHHATTGFYLLAAMLGRLNGEEFSDQVWAAIARALDFSLALTQPDGFTPEIGGADDGKPIRMEQLPLWDFRPYLSIGAVVFDRPDYKAVAGRFYEDALWLLGPAGLRAFEELPIEAPPTLGTLLRVSGYAVDRSDWSRRADYVCFDVGEQAAGMRPDGVPNSMHGHADGLSLVLWLGGQRVLADSGLFAYNCGGPWEAHFRETAAHNTAKVDGRDQARHIGKMAWSHSYRASIEGRFEGQGQAWTMAAHDGFARGPNGVVHRRAVWLRTSGYVVVADEFTGAGQHELEIIWQFAPGTLVPDGDGAVCFNSTIQMVWQTNVSLEAQIRCGGHGPADGWICRSLGVREAAPRLTLRTGRVSLPVTVITVLADTARNRIERVGQEDPAVLSVIHGRERDLLASGGVPSVGVVETDALVAICRLTAKGAVEPMHIGGTFCHLRAGSSHSLLGEPACPRS